MKYTLEVNIRTNIVIDDELLNEAFSLSNARTKKDLIHEALSKFIRLSEVIFKKSATQLKNIILSSKPSWITNPPDNFAAG